MADSQPFAETLAAFQQNPLSLLWRIPGCWPVHKPSGPSSNLIVVRARKTLNIKKIGHAGTLDPMASGLLLLLAGNATRLFDHMQEFTKSYQAEFRLGVRTDTQDATGTPIANWQPTTQPPITRETITTTLDTFKGDILQTPPMHSALKKDGQPLYKLARKGETVERAPRPVSVHNLTMTNFDGLTGTLDMTVSKGFYVRTLIEDLGLALGCGAVMTSLTRTAIGPFTLDDAVPLDNLADKKSAPLPTG